MKTKGNKIIVINENIDKNSYYSQLNKYGYNVNYDINNEEDVNVILIDGSEQFKLFHMGKIKMSSTLRKIPVVGIIEANELKNMTLYMEWGMDDFIKVPYDLDEVIFRLEK